MIDLDALTALDALQWLRTGDEVAKRFGISTASVSRQTRRCLELFGLDLQRLDGEWHTLGDTTVLQLERRVHQTARWLGRRPLRLEATYWSGPLLCDPAPDRWILGLSNIVGVNRNFQLLRERIVDAYMAGLPDLPAADDPDLTATVLSRTPIFFVADQDHPLARQSALTYADIAAYPTLALPDGAYPQVEASLRSLGLWRDAVRMARYRRDAWEGKAEAALTIGYATALSMAVSGSNLVRLPLDLPFDSGEALVFRRDLADQPELLALQHLLASRLAALAVRFPEIRLSDGALGPGSGMAGKF